MVSKVGVGAIFTCRQGGSCPEPVAQGFLVDNRGATNIAITVILLTDGILNTFWVTLIGSAGLICRITAPIGAVPAWRYTPESRAGLFQRVPSLSVCSVLLAPAEPRPRTEDEGVPARPGTSEPPFYRRKTARCVLTVVFRS